MTIALAVSTPQGIVLASESRAINGTPQWYANFEKGIYSNDFKVLEGEHPKVHKIGNYCLIYSGVSRLTYPGLGYTGVWTSDHEIARLQRMAADGYGFKALAEGFYNRLKEILNGHGFGFLLCGYDCGGFQVWAEGSSDSPFVINGGPGSRPKYCMRAFGTVEVIGRLISNEVIRFEAMSLQEALTFALLNVSVGCKYLEWFDRLPAVSGGNIYVAVVTPGGIQGFKFPEYNPAVPGGAIPWHIQDIAPQNRLAVLRDGTYGQEIGGNIYASTFRTGDENSDTYIALIPPNGLMAYYGGQKTLEMVANSAQGWMKYYYNGSVMGEITARSDGAGLDIDTSFFGKKLHIQGTSIEMYSGDGSEFTLSTNTYFNMLGKFWNNFLPHYDNSGYVGMNGYKWNTVRAQFITPGDLCFEEESCPICEQPFAPGDIITLLAHHIHEEHHTMCIPIHDHCKGIARTITTEVPETEERYQLKADGQMEKYRVSRFIETEEQVHRIKDGHELDETTGQFKKKAMVVSVARDGFTAKQTKNGLKFYDDHSGNEVNLRNILEPVEVFQEQAATKDEAVEVVPVKKRQPVMKTIQVEINAPATETPAATDPTEPPA